MEYARIAMGLKNSSSHFQRMFENTLRKFLWWACLGYCFFAIIVAGTD
jgi:hypothetical protein